MFGRVELSVRKTLLKLLLKVTSFEIRPVFTTGSGLMIGLAKVSLLSLAAGVYKNASLLGVKGANTIVPRLVDVS